MGQDSSLIIIIVGLDMEVMGKENQKRNKKKDLSSKKELERARKSERKEAWEVSPPFPWWLALDTADTAVASPPDSICSPQCLS